MLRLTPRSVRRKLLPLAYAIFLTGTLVSSAIFYTGKAFDPKQAVLSDMQSPDDNPHGYGASALGTAISAVLLAPAVSLFYRRLRPGRPRLALAGAIMFAVGLASAIAVGILAPFTHGYTPLHVQLASAAFVGVSAGTWLYLLGVRVAPALLAVQLAIVMLLVFLCYGPVNFDNSRLLTSLAFSEWVLCLDCAATLWILAGRIETGAAGQPPPEPQTMRRPTSAS